MLRILIAAATLAAASIVSAASGLAHVEVRGDGDIPLILVPGLACDWTVWEEFMDRNADRYTMYAVTIPGMAGAEPPAGREGPRAWMESAADAIVVLAKERQLDKPIVVGHSLGAMFALEAAIQDQDKFGAIVMVDGYPAFPFAMEATPEQRAEMVAQMMEPQLAGMTEQMFEQQMQGAAVIMVSDPARAAELREMFIRTDVDAWKRYLLEGLRSDLRPQMDALALPVIGIAAMNRDFPNPGFSYDDTVQYWKDVMSAAPRGRAVFFEDTRHFVMDDRPEEFDRAIRAVAEGRTPEGVSEDKPEGGE